MTVGNDREIFNEGRNFQRTVDVIASLTKEAELYLKIFKSTKQKDFRNLELFIESSLSTCESTYDLVKEMMKSNPLYFKDSDKSVFEKNWKNFLSAHMNLCRYVAE